MRSDWPIKRGNSLSRQEAPWNLHEAQYMLRKKFLSFSIFSKFVQYHLQFTTDYNYFFLQTMKKASK